MSEAHSTRLCTVYGLRSTCDHKIRYVGQTVGKIGARLSGHLHFAKRRPVTPIAKWIVREVERGYRIEIFAIETDAVLHAAEIRLIAHFRKFGARLLNLTAGGEGTVDWHGNKGSKRPDLAERNRLGVGKPGHPTSAEAREKIAASKRGKKYPWLSERNRANAGKPGHPHTEEHKQYMSEKLKGRKHSDETRRKISEAKKGKPLAPERIAKLRAGHKAHFDRIRASALVEEPETG